MKRKAAESHDLVCPEATVDCQFAEAGCEVKPKRKDLESHLDANMKQHLSQLMTAHVTMKQEFQAYKESHKEKDQHAVSPPSLGEQAHETASKKTSPLLPQPSYRSNPNLSPVPSPFANYHEL